MGHADVIFDLMTGGSLAAAAAGAAGGEEDASKADASSSSSSSAEFPVSRRVLESRPRTWADPLMAALLAAIAEGEGGAASEAGAAALEAARRAAKGEAGVGRPHLRGEEAAAAVDG